MQFKHEELLQWIRNELYAIGCTLNSLEELADGYHFLEIVHAYHPKAIDMTQGFSRSDRNEYMVLQNYKLLARAFNKLGWRKFDPERYVKKKEKDYIALAEFLRKTLTSHALNDSPRMEKPKCLLSKHTLSTNKVLAFSQSIIQTSDPLQALEKKKQKLLSATIAIQHEIGAAQITTVQNTTMTSERGAIQQLRQKLKGILATLDIAV